MPLIATATHPTVRCHLLHTSGQNLLPNNPCASSEEYISWQDSSSYVRAGHLRTCVHTSFFAHPIPMSQFFFGFRSPVTLVVLASLIALCLTRSVYASGEKFPLPISTPQVVVDGRIGICPVEIFVPFGRCFCFGLFSKVYRTTAQGRDTAICLSIIGTRREIRTFEDFCIPFSRKDGAIAVKRLFRFFNQLLGVCRAGVTIELA